MRLRFILIYFLFTNLYAQTTIRPCPTDTNAVWHKCLGEIAFPDGNRYIGPFENDSFHGLGRGEKADGTVYVGEYKLGKRNGEGIEYKADGSIARSGLWSDGNLTKSTSLSVSSYPFKKLESERKGGSVLADKGSSSDNEIQIFRLNSKYWWTDMPKGFNRTTYNKVLGCRDIRDLAVKDGRYPLLGFSQIRSKVSISIPFATPVFDTKGLPTEVVKAITSKKETKVQSLKIDNLSLSETLVFDDGSTSTFKYEYEKSGLIRYLVAVYSGSPDADRRLISNIEDEKRKGLPGILKVVCFAQGADENSPF
jgi:hypothetical protein